MNQSDLLSILERSRRKTNELLDAVEAAGDSAAILAWRPGTGRAHIAWQIMHVAATDDRHLHVRMLAGAPREPDYIARFAGGSTPDDNVPPLAEIRRYLSERRQEILAHLAGLKVEQLSTKPQPEAPWAYEEWFQVLAWHEAHHHGQAHLTLNLYKAR